MPIPKEILAVERPTNTVVCAYGKDKNRYAVKRRVGCKRVDGKNVPITGPTIGHIVGNTYVPKAEGTVSVSRSPVTLKDWASVELCQRLSKDIADEIRLFYNGEDALKIISIAILRVCDPGIKDYELKEAYENSFLSETLPGAALSKNTVSAFLRDLGRAYSRIVGFMQYKVSQVEEAHHVVVDGTLKNDTSQVNSLSDYSRKSRDRSGKDISVLYAFDLETMEPIASKCFPGNMLDVNAYEGFVSEYKITKGLLVGDKGFPSSSIREHLGKHEWLHYLNPLKRNSAYIKEYGLTSYQGLFGENGITYSKAHVGEEGKWVYLFRDSRLASLEEGAWLEKCRATGTFDNGRLEEARPSFGTILLESDIDMDPELAFKAYEERWKIELVMRYYKTVCDFDETREHSDYSVIGSEFVNFISSQITCRLVNLFDKTGLTKKHSYRRIMKVLVRAKKARNENEKTWYLVRVMPSHGKILKALGLVTDADLAPTQKKKGRPAAGI